VAKKWLARFPLKNLKSGINTKIPKLLFLFIIWFFTIFEEADICPVFDARLIGPEFDQIPKDNVMNYGFPCVLHMACMLTTTLCNRLTSEIFI